MPEALHHDTIYCHPRPIDVSSPVAGPLTVTSEVQGREQKDAERSNWDQRIPFSPQAIHKEAVKPHVFWQVSTLRSGCFFDRKMQRYQRLPESCCQVHIDFGSWIFLHISATFRIVTCVQHLCRGHDPQGVKMKDQAQTVGPPGPKSEMGRMG